MKVILAENNYGKSRVRLLKVRRDGARHSVHEWEVAIRFEGDFEAAHRAGDNALVLPTDTMKNTVYAKAADTSATSPEGFALELARFFLDRNAAAERVGVDIVETPWTRWTSSGRPHDHAFVAGGSERRLASIAMDRDGVQVIGGLADLLVMKTAHSAFFGYPRDEYTTLPETKDRIFRTVIAAEWTWATGGAAFDRFDAARTLLVDTFAGHDSRSVQETLFAMGEAVLSGVAEIDEIRLSLPNQHCLPVDLSRFGLDNRNEIFVVTEEPHGLIEATIRRG